MQHAQELPKAVQSVPEEDFCGEARREWFSVYPREFLKHELWLKLKPSHRSVFQALYLHADKNHRCWPSLKTIAEEAGVCESTARSSLHYLEETHFIKTESRYRQGQQTSNLYTLLVWPMEAQLWGNVETIPEGGAESTGVGHQNLLGEGVNVAPGTTSREQYPERTTSNNTTASEITDVAALPEMETVVVADSPSEDERQGIVNAMAGIGIAKVVAKKLAESFDISYIQNKLTLLNDSPAVHNKAAWLVSAIKNDYQPATHDAAHKTEAQEGAAPDAVEEFKVRGRQHATEERVNTTELLSGLFSSEATPGRPAPEKTPALAENGAKKQPVITSKPAQPAPVITRKWSSRQLRKMRELAVRGITDPDEVIRIVGEPELAVDDR